MLIGNPSIILIVDDHPTNLKLLYSFLQESGFKVLVAKTGESALQKLQKVSPDLILLDVMMPELDGFETCQRLKASEKTKDIPVIFMTALSESNDKIKGLKVGAVDYITKPFQQEEVLARIENQLKIRRLQKQLEEQNQQLQQSQSWLESVLNTSLDGVAVLESVRDSQHRIVDFKWILLNPTAEKMMAPRAKNLLGKQVLEEMPEIREIGLFPQYVAVVETGQSLETECYYSYETLHAWTHIVAVKLNDGVAVTFRNITDRKRAEESLRQSEQRFRAIFNNSFQFAGLLTPDGTVIEANQTVLNWGGIEYNDLMGHPLWEAQWWTLDQKNHPQVLGQPTTDNSLTPKQKQLKDAIATAAAGQFVRFEVDLTGIDGTVFTIDFSIKPVFNDTGKVVLLIPEGRDITDRKKTEERLRLLESVVVNANDSVIITEAEPINIPGPRIIYVNEAFTRMTGYSKDEVIGKTPRLLHGEKTNRAQLERIRQALETQQPMQTELMNYRKDGSEFWVEFELVPVADAAGKLTHWVCLQRDITERKLSQEALLFAQNRLEYLLSSSPSIIYSCQTTKPYTATFISENVTAVLGYEPQEFIQGSSFWFNHIHPDDRELLFAQVPQLLEVGHYAYEYRFLHKDGTYHWVYDACKLVRDEAGNPIECIGSMSDITQRKQIEAAWQESQHWLSAINEANPNILYVYDLIEQQIVYCNREIYPILGYTPEEVQQMSSVLLSTLVHPEDCAGLLEHFQQFEAAKEGIIFECEYRIRQKNGEWRWLFCRETVFAQTSEGKPKQILGSATDISDRKRVEEALRQSEERFQLAIEGSGLGLWDWHISTGEIYLSPQWKTMLGYNVEEIENSFSVWERLVHPEDLPHALQAINDHFTGRSPVYEAEYRMLSKTGEWKWMLGRGKLMEQDESGTPVRMTGTNKDVTDRKRAEEALQQSEARLQKLTANVPGMLYEFVLYPDGSYRFAYVSSGCRDINELEPEQLMENPALGFEIVHPDDVQRLSTSIQTSAQTLEPWVWEGRIITPSGKVKWTQGGARPERYTNGEILWHGLVVDVSDRKQTELELQAAKAALERQIQRVLLQERITQEIRSSLKPEQIFQTAATQIGQTFAVSRCIIHTYITEPFPRIPQVAEYLEPGYSSMMELEIPVIGNDHAQLVLSQDQAIASDDVYNEPLLEEIYDLLRQLTIKSVLIVRTSYQGRPNGIICLEQCDRFRHWTDEEIELLEAVAVQMGIALAQANLLEQEKQRRQELALQNHALEKAKLEAEAANRAKSQFLSKMSHELRTPLNAILGFTQVMARDESVGREHQEHLEIINRSGEHLLELINDILSMSKIESGQVSLNKNRFDLYRLLDSLEEMLRFKAVAKGIELIFERAIGIPRYIQTDESKLRQVLINLLGNAIKFTQIGRVTLRVRVGDGESGRHSLPKSKVFRLLFEVEDTGPGIAPDELGILFDPFVQTETGRQSMEGTGLGLPISQQFVHMMGGQIAVRSTPNQGTIFTFNIQASLATAADEKPILSKGRVIGLEANQPSYRILVVEDAAVNRKLLVKILEPLGFEVRTATNGHEGVALWESWSPHLILMDVIMPIMDGYEATQLIKQTRKGRETVIIALTASAFDEQREAIIRVGCDDFISKPFQRDELLDKMAHHLGVDYIYEEQPIPPLPQSPDPKALLTPEALAVMPVSWLIQLHQAALYADDELIRQLIEQIPVEHCSLRQDLQGLIDNFRLEQLIDLTELGES